MGATPFADRQTDAGNDEFEPAAAHHSWRTRHGDAHVPSRPPSRSQDVGRRRRPWRWCGSACERVSRGPRLEGGRYSGCAARDDARHVHARAEVLPIPDHAQEHVWHARKKGSPATKAAAAAVASLPEGFTIQPLEVAKISLQLDKANKFQNNMTLVMKDIMATRGWTGLFTGYFGIQYRQTSWTAAYFATLQLFSEKSRAVIPKEYVTLQNLTGGFLAGMFGAVFNTPGDVIRSSSQKAILAAAPQKHPFSIGLCASGVAEFFKMGGQILAKNGIGGLYMGFGFKALHLGGSGALLGALIPMFKKMML